MVQWLSNFWTGISAVLAFFFPSQMTETAPGIMLKALGEGKEEVLEGTNINLLLLSERQKLSFQTPNRLPPTSYWLALCHLATPGWKEAGNRSI